MPGTVPALVYCQMEKSSGAVGTIRVVLGQPHRIGGAQLGRETQQVALVSVEHGRVAGRGDGLAERTGIGGQLLAERLLARAPSISMGSWS